MSGGFGARQLTSCLALRIAVLLRLNEDLITWFYRVPCHAHPRRDWS